VAFSTQSITSAATNTVVPFTDCDSAVITNTHDTNDITIDLWISGTASTDIVATGTLVNLASGIQGYAVTTGSQAIVVDGDSATEAEFLNERIYKSDGTFVGVCTAVGSVTGMTFGGGIETNLANNDNLYVGNRYYLLNNVVIPNGASLKLESNEVNFDTDNHILLAIVSATGIDIIFR
jgi:hypothetical protein|tara:strand:+ start:1956 stop:2492 length:537 start_codon:yes stop_codon:yes gene_type:complete